MQAINFEMVHKGLKPSRSARQLQDTLSQEFMISTDQNNTLKFGSSATQSNKFAFRPSGDSDQCDTHHSEEVNTQFDECGATPSHNLNIQPVAEVRRDSYGSEHKYQYYDLNDGSDDINKLNSLQYQLTNSQIFEQMKRRSNSKPPLSRNNSTNNKDEITQFRGTEQCIAMNNSRKNSHVIQTEEENFIKQKVLINFKDLNNFEMQKNLLSHQNQQTFVSHTIESHRITPNKMCGDNLQSAEASYLKNQVSAFKQDINNNNNNNNNYSSQQKESNYYDWSKEYAGANIPIPLQRVSSPQRLIQYQEQKYFATSQPQQMIKQNDECCESLKPEDLLMSQQEYNRFQEVQKQINVLQQLPSQNAAHQSSQDILVNNFTSFQGPPGQNNQEFQSIQQINCNEIVPVSLSKEASLQKQQNQPSHFNFNSTYSFSNNQFKQYGIAANQQYPRESLQESGFNPEQQLNSISSSSILNIQSPKSNTITQPLSQILQKESDKEDVQLHLQKMKENILKQQPLDKKENKNNTSAPSSKSNNFLKRNQSVNNLTSNPTSGKRSLHEGIDRSFLNQENQTPNSKEQKRTTTPQSQNRILERKMSDNLLLDKSKKKIESYEDQQLKECTFKPQINKQSQQMQRSFSQFLDTQNIYNKNKADKFKMVQEQFKNVNEMEIKEKPDISRASQRIIEQKRNQDQQSLFGVPLISEKQSVHNRLYSFHKKNESSHSQNRKRIEEDANQENTFKPQIHQRSKSIKRDERIEDLLYKDAVRRNNLQQNFQNQKTPQNSKYMSEKSEKILLKKFMKEMDYIVGSLTINQNKTTTSSQLNSNFINLDMASLFEIMIKSGFIKYNNNTIPDSVVQENEKKLIFLMWTLLGGKQFNTITIENLFFFFLIILNLDKNLDNSERSIFFKELSYSMSHSSSSQTPSPMASQNSLKNFKNFETFTSLISSNMNQQQQPPHSAPISPLNKSSASSSLYSSPSSSSSSMSTIHQQLNTSLMKSYHENYINISLGTFDNKQQWIVNDDDKAVIRQAFELFYRNRLSYEELKSQKNPAEQQCTFHPNILQSSKIMANQYREKLLIQTANLLENKELSYQVPKDGKIQHSDFLILQKRAQEAQNKSKQVIEKDKELLECSFRPQISQKGNQDCDKSTLNAIAIKKTEELYQQSRGKENKPLKNTNEVEFEKSKNECTFQPELKENRFRKNYEGGIYAKNVNKTIERMRNARKEREVVNVMKQRGYNSVQQVNRHQKSISSSSNAQIDQTSENYQSCNTRKEESLRNCSSNNSQHFSNNGERITSYNSCSNENQAMHYNNITTLPKNQSLNGNPYSMEPSHNLQSDNQFLQPGQMMMMMNGQFNNFQSNPSSQQSQYISSTQQFNNQQHLLNNNMFANQAIQQFSQKNLTNLQHSFASQSPLYNFTPNPYNNDFNNPSPSDNNDNNNNNNNNNIVNYIPEKPTLLQNQISNPLLEQSAAKFGNQILNSWTQNTNNLEQYPNNAGEDNKGSEKCQESVQSVPDSKDRTPLLFVDVNLGNQRNERIIVNEGDNPKQLAYNFARLHGLDDQTAEKLFQLLENQIAGLLSRIEEEDNISHLENLD